MGPQLLPCIPRRTLLFQCSQFRLCVPFSTTSCLSKMSLPGSQTNTIIHPKLGQIHGISESKSKCTVYHNLPYATLKHRFSRSELLTSLPQPSPYDATKPGPICIQPPNPIMTDTEANQFPMSSDIHPNDDELTQSWNCLNLSITVPDLSEDSKSQSLPSGSKALPVLVFIHGGAFSLGSHEFPQYNPLHLVKQGIDSDDPFIFAAINYRLGPLGFFHHQDVEDLIPANNGLCDQYIALTWLRRFVSGFGGDPNRMTVIGQSAGGESIALGITSGSLVAGKDDRTDTSENKSEREPLFRQAICFSGSTVTMPAKTPEEHSQNFLEQAKKCGIDVDKLSIRQVAEKMIYKVEIDSIRKLGWVGAPCTSVDMIPFDKLTMATPKTSKQAPTPIHKVIYSSASFDGGISYNITSKTDKKDHARTFTEVVQNRMSSDGAKELLELYDITSKATDKDALEKICQFESDIGFFMPSLAQVEGSQCAKTYFQLWDLKNPFKGPLDQHKKATHTWDIVALLGAYEDREEIPSSSLAVIQEWRQRIIRFVCDEDYEPWEAWGEEEGKIMVVGDDELKVQPRDWYMGPGTRIARLLEIARKEKGDEGCDLLWEGVCRKWLDG